jgi:hypothetical protein
VYSSSKINVGVKIFIHRSFSFQYKINYVAPKYKYSNYYWGKNKLHNLISTVTQTDLTMICQTKKKKKKKLRILNGHKIHITSLSPLM